MVSKSLLHWIYGSEPYVKHACTSHECCKHSICIHMWCHLSIIIYGTLLLAHAMSCIVALRTLIVVCPQLSCSCILWWKCLSAIYLVMACLAVVCSSLACLKLRESKLKEQWTSSSQSRQQGHRDHTWSTPVWVTVRNCKIYLLAINNCKCTFIGLCVWSYQTKFM